MSFNFFWWKYNQCCEVEARSTYWKMMLDDGDRGGWNFARVSDGDEEMKGGQESEWRDRWEKL